MRNDRDNLHREHPTTIPYPLHHEPRRFESCQGQSWTSYYYFCEIQLPSGTMPRNLTTRTHLLLTNSCLWTSAIPSNNHQVVITFHKKFLFYILEAHRKHACWTTQIGGVPCKRRNWKNSYIQTLLSDHDQGKLTVVLLFILRRSAFPTNWYR